MTDIDTVIDSRKYGPLFSLSETDIQIYFDNCCQNNMKDKVRLLIFLFPNIDITNALLFTYRNNMRDVFGLLCVNKVSIIKENIAELLIEDCYIFNNYDSSKCIHTELLSILVDHKLCNCDQLFIAAAKLKNFELARITLNSINNETLVAAFKIVYESGYLPIADIIYSRIRCNRIIVDEYYDYCPSGNIIKMIAFQEFYDWKTQLKNSVINRNHYAIEVLVCKMQKNMVVSFDMISDLLETATDSLLAMICDKFLIKDIDRNLVIASKREPMLKYIESKLSDWLVV
jgi:hypothetical protein